MHLVKITIPPKEQPYTQYDMDVVIGHPIRFNIGAPGMPIVTGVGIISDAMINEDGSATITAEVQF